MRSTLFGLLVAVAACGGTSAKRNGESCTASSECDTGLACDMGRDPHVCAPSTTIPVDSPVVTDDAGVDAAGPDSSIDAAPPVDGPPIDARPIDAPPIDAPPIDAPIDAAIDAPVDAPEIDAM